MSYFNVEVGMNAIIHLSCLIIFLILIYFLMRLQEKSRFILFVRRVALSKEQECFKVLILLKFLEKMGAVFDFSVEVEESLKTQNKTLGKCDIKPLCQLVLFADIINVKIGSEKLSVFVRNKSWGVDQEALLSDFNKKNIMVYF